MNPPEAASTWMGMSNPVFFWRSSTSRGDYLISIKLMEEMRGGGGRTEVAHELDVLEMACVGASHDDDDSDSVLVDERDSIMRVEYEPIRRFHRNQPTLHVEIPISIPLH